MGKATKQQTNFEKWKAELTVDELTKLIGMNCKVCPLDGLHRCHNDDWCEVRIRAWAEQESVIAND